MSDLWVSLHVHLISVAYSVLHKMLIYKDMNSEHCTFSLEEQHKWFQPICFRIKIPRPHKLRQLLLMKYIKVDMQGSCFPLVLMRRKLLLCTLAKQHRVAPGLLFSCMLYLCRDALKSLNDITRGLHHLVRRLRCSLKPLWPWICNLWVGWNVLGKHMVCPVLTVESDIYNTVLVKQILLH